MDATHHSKRLARHEKMIFMLERVIKSVGMLAGLVFAFIFAVVLVATIEYARMDSGLPTAGPITQGGFNQGLLLEIHASTNCADVGEVVIFSIIMANRASSPILLPESLQLDIFLQPGQWTQSGDPPIRRWSETDQYPASFKTELMPGEKRTYEWRWIAEADFAQQIPLQNNLAATLKSGDFSNAGGNIPAGDIGVLVGIGSYPWVQRSSFTCTELRQNR